MHLVVELILECLVWSILYRKESLGPMNWFPNAIRADVDTCRGMIAFGDRAERVKSFSAANFRLSVDSGLLLMSLWGHVITHVTFPEDSGSVFMIMCEEVWVYACLYMWVHACVCLSESMCVHIYRCVCVLMCMHMHVCKTCPSMLYDMGILWNQNVYSLHTWHDHFYTGL